MAMAMQADSVTGGHDLRRGRRVAQYLLAYEKERSPRSTLGKNLEHGRRALCVWAVVESDCRAAACAGFALDSECPAQRPRIEGERRQKVACHRHARKRSR